MTDKLRDEKCMDKERKDPFLLLLLLLLLLFNAMDDGS
jgi:hypothetical protein